MPAAAESATPHEANAEGAPHFADTVPLERDPHMPAAPSNFIAKHWRGAYPLGFSYWVCGAALTALVLGLSKWVQSGHLMVGLGQRGTGASILLIYASLLLTTLWQVVGIWRSAGFHTQRGGRSGWAVAARMMVVLMVLRTSFELYQTGYPVMVEGVRLLVGEDHTPPHAIRLLRDGTELELAGGMPFGTADAVQHALDAAPAIKVIHLNSQGGRMQEAYLLFKTIESRNLITYTSAQCASACAFAFLAGRERFVGENGQLGFHSVSIGTLSGRDVKDINDEYRRALQSRGVPDSFIERALSAPPKDIWFPTHAELLNNKVVDAVVDSKAYALSGLSQWHDVHQIENGLLAVPTFAALAKFDAKNYARLRDLIVAGIQKGSSQNEIQTKIRAVFMGDVIPVYLKTAQDAPLVAYWQTQIAEMNALASNSQQLCADFAYPQFAPKPVDLKSVLPKPLVTQDLQALAGLIESGATQPHAVDNAATQTQTDLVAAVTRMSATVPHGLEVVRTPAKYRDDPGALCTATLAMYREILATPGQDRVAAILRDLH